VNPLSAKFQKAIVLPDWRHCFSSLDRPFHLDIGSARGTFLLEMAKAYPDWNFLGTEIRESLVQEANDRAAEQGLKNVYYLFCNINQQAPTLLESLPSGSLQYVTIQFPDPWFKKRHQKRRVLQPQLVKDLAQFMANNSTLFLQSDVEPVLLEMIDRVEESGAFQRLNPDWLPENPLGVPTERERSVLRRNLPVYRVQFRRVLGESNNTVKGLQNC
jgi:tRNA (guanine-N7-)-methyltransferase